MGNALDARLIRWEPDGQCFIKLSTSLGLIRRMEGLKRRAVISLAASYLSQLGTTAGDFLTKVILARLILPAQWGVFTEAMLVVLAADVFTDLGLSQHVARENKRPFGNMLLVRTILSIIAIGVVELLAPHLKFFSPEVIGPARALAPLILIKAVGTVPTVFLDRELMIHKSLAPQFARLTCMAVVSIALAVSGYGVWALVGGALVSETAYTALVWISARKHLHLDLTLAHTRRLLTGSRYLFLIAAVGLILQQGDIFVTGTLLNPRIVGLYAMALTIVTRVSKVVEMSIYRVIYPMFCEVSNDHARLGLIYKCMTLAVVAIEAPIYCYLLFHSGFVVSSVLGPKWMPMAVILQALAMSGIVNPFATFGIEVLRATKQDVYLTIASIVGATVLLVAGLILTSRFGAMGMVAANYMPIGAIFIIIALWRTIRRDFIDLAKKLAVVYVVSMAVSGGVFLFGGHGVTRHIVGIVAMFALWGLFYRLYGSSVGKETLRSL